jgi:hypothetical protein
VFKALVKVVYNSLSFLDRSSAVGMVMRHFVEIGYDLGK